MFDTLITWLQLFTVGFGFGFFGPCAFSCTPVITTYLVGTHKRISQASRDAFIFFTGRLFAYCLLGLLVGLSVSMLRAFVASQVIQMFKPIAALVSILLGISLLVRTKSQMHQCTKPAFNQLSRIGLFSLGITTGLSPCAPLVVLFTQIALLSKNASDAVVYALFFGIGTFVSGMLVTVGIVGIIRWIPRHFLENKKTKYSITILCAGVLIVFGIYIFIFPKIH